MFDTYEPYEPKCDKYLRNESKHLSVSLFLLDKVNVMATAKENMMTKEDDTSILNRPSYM